MEHEGLSVLGCDRMGGALAYLLSSDYPWLHHSPPTRMSRTVDLPLERIERCWVCGSDNNLKTCKQCAERVYCSVACQTKDWKEGGHKRTCTKYDHLDVEFIYPFFAGIARLCREKKHFYFPHPADVFSIINSPNPRTPASIIPGTTDKAVIVQFGRPIDSREVTGPRWWPTARSPEVRRKLFRRMTQEGNVLALNFVVAFAILAEIYGEKDVRLKYRSSPIADFGIAKGKVRVLDNDRLAYQLPDGSFRRGQDPDDHYWMYFTTARGEELILDFCMYTFNCSISVPTKAYFDIRLANMPGTCPAYFQNRANTKHQQKMGLEGAFHQETCRFSVLRDESLRPPVEKPPTMLKQTDVFFAFMEKVAGHSIDRQDRVLVPVWLQHATFTVAATMDEKMWKSWPKGPGTGNERRLE